MPQAKSVAASRRTLTAQLVGILRKRDGVQVHDAVDVLVDILLVHPVADRAEIVADVRDAGGLDAGEDALALRGRFLAWVLMLMRSCDLPLVSFPLSE